MGTNYATNESGDMLELVEGEWVKVPQAQNEKGEKIFYTGGKWQPAPRRVREGWLKTERAKIMQRGLKLGLDKNDLFVEANTPMESQLAGLDKGLEDVAYGTSQLAQHLLPGKDTTEIDATIAEREKYAPNNAGQFVGNVAGMMAPGGAGIKFARMVPWLAGTGIVGESAVGGALEGASMPVNTEGNSSYAGEKAQQVGLSTGLSTGVAAGVKAATAAGETAVNLGRNAENLPSRLSMRQVRSGSPMATEGDRLANQYDVPLTPGQSSDSATLKFLEQRARQSWLSKESALDGDTIRAAKMKDAIEAQAGDVNSASFAQRLQANVDSFVRGLAKKRSEMGRAMYGEIDRVAGGAKVVQPKAFYDELLAIIKEAGTQETGDIVKAAKQARQILANIDKQGGYSAQEALGRLQSYSPHSAGTVFDDVSKGFDAVLKRRMYGALLEDMSAAEAVGGNVGEMVKRANAAWRTASENIDSVKKSALGKIVGEDIATDLFNFNTVAPEQVMDKLTRLRPSQAKAVAGFLEQNMPDMLDQLQGSILKDAVDASMEMAATAGSQVSFNPGNFLRALGLKGGKGGAEATRRLMHYFGGENSPRWKMMSDLIQLSRRLADVSGKNFSDTAAANQFFDIVRKGVTSGGNFVGAVAGTALEAAGLKRVTQSMHPNSPLFGGFNARPLIEAPRIIKKSPVPVGLAAPVVANALDNKPNR